MSQTQTQISDKQQPIKNEMTRTFKAVRNYLINACFIESDEHSEEEMIPVPYKIGTGYFMCEINTNAKSIVIEVRIFERFPERMRSCIAGAMSTENSKLNSGRFEFSADGERVCFRDSLNLDFSSCEAAIEKFIKTSMLSTLNFSDLYRFLIGFEPTPQEANRESIDALFLRFQEWRKEDFDTTQPLQ